MGSVLCNRCKLDQAINSLLVEGLDYTVNENPDGSVSVYGHTQDKVGRVQKLLDNRYCAASAVQLRAYFRYYFSSLNVHCECGGSNEEA